jgi:galactose-1-phosphate uridylyltransferase
MSYATIVTVLTFIADQTITYTHSFHQSIHPSFHNNGPHLGRPAHAQLMAMERHPRVVQRPLRLQVDLGEGVK